MLCDLVGSTELAGHFDLEDWRDIISEYHRTAADAVARFGGHVAKNLGDGAPIYFGYPQAHEKMQSGHCTPVWPLSTRFAVAADRQPRATRRNLTRVSAFTLGPVVLSGEVELYGEVANIESRMRAIAELDAVLITSNIHRLVSGLFTVADYGTHTLKGVAQPIAFSCCPWS